MPLLLEQTDRRLLTALRNSLVLFIRRPGFTLGLILFLASLIALSTLVLPPAWLILTASLSAFLANKGAIYLIGDLADRPARDT
jgi:4-hydroxybenzoate polyprenyltransferase